MLSRPLFRSLGLRSALLVSALLPGACAMQPAGPASTETEPSPEESIGEAQQAAWHWDVNYHYSFFNITKYGANPADFNDDTAALQAAIDAAAASGGGTVYIPAGEYDISDSLVLPRSATRPIVFQGEGRQITRIATEGNLPSSKPVITFSGTGAAKDFAFRDLQIGRTTPGVVFYHDQPTPGTTLWRASFERVVFAAPDDTDGVAPGVPSFDLVHIEGAVFSFMDDVAFIGGDTGLRLVDSLYVDLHRLNTEQDLQVNHGVVLSGGGGHSIDHSLLGASDGGTSLRVEGGADGISHVRIEDIAGGGKRTAAFIELAGTSASPVRDVTMKDVHLPGPWGPVSGVFSPSYGIHVNDWVRDVRVLTASASSWSANLPNGGKLLFVEAGAADIQVEKLLFVDPVENGGLADYVTVEPGATRVHVELVDGASDRWVRDEGMTPDWVVSGDTAYVGADPTVVAATTPGSPITKLLQRKGGAVVATPPQRGQRVLLLGSAAAPVLAEDPSGNVNLSTSPLTLDAGTVLQLVYDGATWQEVSRSVN